MKVATLVVSIVFLSLPAISFAQAPVAGVPYQIPAGFEAYPLGTLITYGGVNYVVQPNATMLLAAVQPSQVPQVVQPVQNTQPVQVIQPTQPAQYYQIPAGYGGYAPGTSIKYGGVVYIIQPNGLMAPPWVVQSDLNRLNVDQNRISNDYYRLGNDLNSGNIGGALNDLFRINNDERRIQMDQLRLQMDTGGLYTPW